MQCPRQAWLNLFGHENPQGGHAITVPTLAMETRAENFLRAMGAGKVSTNIYWDQRSDVAFLPLRVGGAGFAMWLLGASCSKCPGAQLPCRAYCVCQGNCRRVSGFGNLREINALLRT